MYSPSYHLAVDQIERIAGKREPRSQISGLPSKRCPREKHTWNLGRQSGNPDCVADPPVAYVDSHLSPIPKALGLATLRAKTERKECFKAATAGMCWNKLPYWPTVALVGSPACHLPRSPDTAPPHQRPNSPRHIRNLEYSWAVREGEI